MALAIVRVNPLEYESGLKALMTSHDVAGFAEFFDQGYASAVRDGARSWIGLDDSRTLQMNVTLFVHRFDFRGRSVTGGMLGNMMVATPYRTFFPAITLLKRVVRDARECGGIDFLYGDPGPKGAQAIFQGSRLQQVGNLDRYVVPMRDTRWHRNIAASAYAAGVQLKAIRGELKADCVPARDSDLRHITRSLGDGDRLQPIHSLELYQRRLPGFPAADDHLVEFRRAGDEQSSCASALLRGPREDRVVRLYVLRHRSDVPVKSLVPGLVRAARRLGGAKLQVETMEGSLLANELVAGGFAPRSDVIPIFAVGFTPVGEEVVSAVNGWELTGVDMER